MASNKHSTAVLWKQGEQYGITLHLPVLQLSTKTGTSSSGHEFIKNVDLPRPMTSNQFNTFIISEEGTKWAHNIFGPVMKKDSVK